MPADLDLDPHEDYDHLNDEPKQVQELKKLLQDKLIRE